MPPGGEDRPGPRRTCIGCRRRAHPDALVRVVRSATGGLAVGRHLPGRGAWICPEEDCLVAARRRRAWSRALRGPVDDGAVDLLAEEVGLAPGTLGGRTSAPRAAERSAPSP